MSLIGVEDVAATSQSGGCCGGDTLETGADFGAALYAGDADGLPEAAVLRPSFHVKHDAQVSRSYAPHGTLYAHPGAEVDRPTMVEFVLVRAPRAGH